MLVSRWLVARRSRRSVRQLAVDRAEHSQEDIGRWRDGRYRLAERAEELAIVGVGALERRLVCEHGVDPRGLVGLERIERAQQHEGGDGVAVAAIGGGADAAAN